MRIVQAKTCFERFDLITVTAARRPDLSDRTTHQGLANYAPTPLGMEMQPHEAKHCYAFFNCNNLYVPSQSWNYRGCWHQTLPLLDPHRVL